MIQSPQRVFIERRVCKQPYMPMHFFKKSETGFASIVMYVDDLNLIGTLEELTRKAKYLK